ncbi:MAG: hypothetical protein WC979_02555 [Candidatus Pacearchaeota archaeon]|jgi:hypothetical protein|nr:hypothetical protein [Clostridia bacterium]
MKTRIPSFDDFLFESNDRIITLYHGTASGKLSSIKLNGLDTNAETNQKTHGFNTSNQISLSFNYSDAYYYGSLFVKTNEPVTVLIIKLPYSYIAGKGLSLNEVLVKQNISSKYIIGAYKDKDIVKLDKLSTNETYVNPDMLSTSDLQHYKSHYKINESIDALEKMGIQADPDKPSIFLYTIYRTPSSDEIKEFENYPQLTADEILNGFCYTCIGRGITSSRNIALIKDSINMLIAAYPDDPRYTEALRISDELKPKF